MRTLERLYRRHQQLLLDAAYADMWWERTGEPAGLEKKWTLSTLIATPGHQAFRAQEDTLEKLDATIARLKQGEPVAYALLKEVPEDPSVNCVQEALAGWKLQL